MTLKQGLGFYGWDTNYTDLAGHEGGFTFLHAATNTSEVFTGTASGITAGNLKLTSGTASSSNTTGDWLLLVVLVLLVQLTSVAILISTAHCVLTALLVLMTILFYKVHLRPYN